MFSASANADHDRQGRRIGGLQRQGRQDSNAVGVDFSGCVNDRESGLCCVEKEETVQTIQKV